MGQKSLPWIRLIIICYIVPWWPSWLSDQIATKAPILDIGTERFSNSELPCHPDDSHQALAQSDLLFGSRCDLQIFKTAAMVALGYQNGTILAILNLHVAPMPSTKCPLHPTYSSGGDNK